MENWKAILLLLAAGQGLFLSAALIFSSFRSRPANVFLAFILFVFSIELLNVWAMPTGYHQSGDNFPFWLLGSYWILPAALWLFVKINLDSNFTLHRIHFLLFIPALIEIFTEFFIFYIQKYSTVRIYLSEYATWFVFTEVLPIVFVIFVLLQYYMLLRKFNTHFKDKKYTFHLVQQYAFLVVFVGLTGLWIAETWLQLEVFAITEALLCGILFILGYIIYFQPTFFQPPVIVRNKPATDLLSNEQEALILLRLRALMEEQKIYRTPRLTLEDLAKELALPVRQVSFIINKHYNHNFNQFINNYRVKEVMERIKDPRENHKTLLAIALEAGFNSKSSFNQIFKTFTGETPSTYLAKHRK